MMLALPFHNYSIIGSLSNLYVILPIEMTRIDFDLVDLNQVSGRITDCRVDPEAFNGLWFWETIRIRRPVK